MTKAEEIYHRFVQYEWSEISERMRKSILDAISEALRQPQEPPPAENLHVNVVRVFSVEIVSDNQADGLLSKETVDENCLADYLSIKVPNCKVDLKRICTDDRCRYFQHYMPTNKTTAKHSYKENHRLHKSGNFVKLYISEVFA